MSNKNFKDGETVYFIENSRIVREAVVAEAGSFYSIRYRNYSGELAGIRLRASRIYKSKEEAEAAVKQFQDMSNCGKKDMQDHKQRSAYAYGRFD